ncbi:MAG TPA: IPT/TIG domain-containing protein, partial [Candidatus Dormibacteraeota bacterium]|nr:IPT/TIG domain-containing protein [Candidatus Dormibacteraeota bacterium]
MVPPGVQAAGLPAAPTPTVDSITPPGGASCGGTTVAVHGTNLGVSGQTSTVDIKFAGTSQTINSITPDHSTDPTGAMGATVGLTTIPQETNGAAADVVVTNQPSGFAPTSTTVHNGWTFVDSQGPTLTAVIKDPATTPDPNHSGPSAGGQHLEVDGTCFIGVQEIDFVTSAGTSKVLPAAMTCSDGSVLNPSVPCPTRDQIRFDVPRAPSNLGQLVADIVVVTPSGRSPITAADQWTYTGFSPSVGPLSPTAGLTGGG